MREVLNLLAIILITGTTVIYCYITRQNEIEIQQIKEQLTIQRDEINMLKDRVQRNDSLQTKMFIMLMERK